MRYVFLSRFSYQLSGLPSTVRKKFEKQLSLLMQDIRYPSLHAKRYDEARGIWQARVDANYRFYFKIEGDAYFLMSILKHPK